VPTHYGWIPANGEDVDQGLNDEGVKRGDSKCRKEKNARCLITNQTCSQARKDSRTFVEHAVCSLRRLKKEKKAGEE